MLKNRLIPCLVLRDGLIVQSINFKRYLPVGKAKIAVEFVSKWDVDEIILLDITATRNKIKPNLDLISSISEQCFVPLTIGGGISEINDIRNIINAVFGNQCIVVSMDVKLNPAGSYEVYGRNGTVPTGLTPVFWAQKVQNLGAGEIFLNSIDRDGSKTGYDLELVSQVSQAVKIPVIACGGVGQMEHLVQGITKGRASAVAAANIFQYTEHSTILAKAALKAAGINIRLNTEATYDDFKFDDKGRILKKHEADLKDIWFEKHKLENI